jgi:hypothetical protein
MAMIGTSIDTQLDIPQQVLGVLIEVTNEYSSAYFTEELSRELEETVASGAYEQPWQIPVASPKDIFLPDLL